MTAVEGGTGLLPRYRRKLGVGVKGGMRVFAQSLQRCYTTCERKRFVVWININTQINPNTKVSRNVRVEYYSLFAFVFLIESLVARRRRRPQPRPFALLAIGPGAKILCFYVCQRNENLGVCFIYTIICGTFRVKSSGS